MVRGMADLIAGLDMSQPVGQRFGPEVIAEIEVVAPSTVNDGDITEPKLDNGAVSTRALADGAVTEEKLGDEAVSTRALADGSVTDDKIALSGLHPEKVAPGIPTATDWNGNYVSLRHVVLTAAQYAALSAPDPNTLYYISA